jgi:hypothetical protein
MWGMRTRLTIYGRVIGAFRAKEAIALLDLLDGECADPNNSAA